mgnify:CR=1 FL=1
MNIEFITKILNLFTSDPFTELTISDISKRSGLSYNATHRTVQYLLKKQVLNVKKIGKASVISLNPTELTLSLLVLSKYQKPIELHDKERLKNKFSELKKAIEKS